MVSTATTQANQEFDRALRLQETGDYAQAAVIFQRLVQGDPNRMSIWGYLAMP